MKTRLNPYDLDRLIGACQAALKVTTDPYPAAPGRQVLAVLTSGYVAWGVQEVEADVLAEARLWLRVTTSVAFRTRFHAAWLEVDLMVAHNQLLLGGEHGQERCGGCQA